MQEGIIKIIFFGDIVGKPGRNAVRDFLATGEKYDFVIANVENASHGFGLTKKNHDDIAGYGVNCMTGGNHIWDKKDIFEYIDESDYLVRPINYPIGTKGVGSRIFNCGEFKIGVINALGRVFMPIMDSQWGLVAKEIEKIREITPIVVVDFHAEATAEKICFGKYCAKLGVSAFLGTHTHVQTADEEIIDGSMAYITDAGFCGARDGVIGMNYQSSLARFLTGLPERYDVANGDIVIVNAIEIDIDTVTGKAVNIKRIYCSKDKTDEVKGEKEN